MTQCPWGIGRKKSVNRPVERQCWRSGVVAWALPEHFVCWLTSAVCLLGEEMPRVSTHIPWAHRRLGVQGCGFSVLWYSTQAFTAALVRTSPGAVQIDGVRFRIQAADWIPTVCAHAPGCVLLSLPAPIFFHCPIWLAASCGLMSCRGLRVSPKGDSTTDV